MQYLGRVVIAIVCNIHEFLIMFFIMNKPGEEKKEEDSLINAYKRAYLFREKEADLEAVVVNASMYSMLKKICQISAEIHEFVILK